MGAHQCRDVAIEIVRRAVDLIGFRHRGDLERLNETIPGHVDDCDIDRTVLEVRAELAAAEQRLAGGNRHPRPITDQAQTFRVVAVDLQPCRS